LRGREHVLRTVERGFQVEPVVWNRDQIGRNLVVVATEGVLFGLDAVDDRVSVGTGQLFECGLQFAPGRLVLVFGDATPWLPPFEVEVEPPRNERVRTRVVPDIVERLRTIRRVLEPAVAPEPLVQFSS